MFVLVFMCFIFIFFIFSRSSKNSSFRLVNTVFMGIAAILTALNLIAVLYEDGYLRSFNFSKITSSEWMFCASLILLLTIAAVVNLKKIRDRS